MPSWAVGYLVVLGIVTAAGVIDDVRSRRRWWSPAAGVLSAGALAFFFAGYWNAPLVRSAGLPGVVVFLAALLWEARAIAIAVRDLRSERGRLEPVEAAIAWAVAGGGIVAFSFGFAVGALGILGAL